MSDDQLTAKEFQALRHLRNAIVHEGRSPSIRELARALGYKSPRTAFLVLNRLIERGWLKRKLDGELQFRKELPGAKDHARTVQIPLVGSVACGVPLLAEENIEAYIPVSTSLAKPGNKYFFLRAVGDSMDAAGIQNGDLMLVRQQSQAENRDKVVALINDEATVKEFHREREMVVLKPKSRNNSNKPIVVTDNFIIQGVVMSVLPAKFY
jgi:repressor LexA